MYKRKKYLTLFLSTLQISAFTFGGGYVIITLLKKKFTDELHWIEEDEMLNMAAIAQSSPGAVAVNAAILVGYKIAGIPGALISIIGTIIPPFVIISVISMCYTAFRNNLIVSAVLKGMQSGIAAVIADVTVNLSCNVYKEGGILSSWFWLFSLPGNLASTCSGSFLPAPYTVSFALYSNQEKRRKG